MEKMKIQEVIVVEGRDDTRRIQEVVEADTIETRGSAIDEMTLEKIKKAQETRGVIVFTDPDFPGEKIRKTIIQAVPEAKHAFLNVKDAVPQKSHGSLGVEHASDESIRNALEKIYTPKKTEDVMIATPTLLAAGLLGGPNARKKREKIGELLQIGYTNSKQFPKRLQMFQISEATFLAALEQILEEEKDV